MPGLTADVQRIARRARDAARQRRLERGESGWGRPVTPPPELPVGTGGRIAVVGAGVQGRVLARSTAALGGADLVGIADLDATRRADAATTLGIDPLRCFADAAEMFSSGPIDLVAVATTAPSHVALGKLAAAAGIRHVLLEKPIDNSYPGAARFVADCEAGGVRLAVNYTRRWLTDHRAVVEAIRAGQIGPVRIVTAQIGTGELGMQGSHYVDLCRMLIGSEPVEVSARLRPTGTTNTRGAEFDDPTGHVLLRFAGGERAYIDFDELAPRDAVVTVRGDDGLIVIEEHRSVWRLRSRSTRTWTFPFAEEFRPLPMTARLLHGVLSEPDDACTGRDGLAALEVLLAAQHSSDDGGRAVPLPLTDAQRQLSVRFP